ncbi:MAG: divalent cation tolerance protein CutA [Rhizobiaceae bacterium]|nr:divalent cation tolerance protein CutA [Rhizobiaceae bacterium]
MIELHVIYRNNEEANDHVQGAIAAGLARSAILVSARAQGRWSHKSEGEVLAVYKIDDDKARAAERFIHETHPCDDPEIVRGLAGSANGNSAGAA